MTLFLPIVILIPIIFCLPGWLIARKRYAATAWSLGFAVPGLAVWVGLAMSGIGPQSLGNIIEVIYLSFGAVPLYYLKVLLVDKIRPDAKMNTIIATLALCVVALIMRLTMPVLPE